MRYKPNRLSKNNKGVTLVEVIAVIAVMSVVMAAVTGFMITGTKMSAKVSGGATAGMREQTAVEYINQRLLEVSVAALALPDETVRVELDGQEKQVYDTLYIDGKPLTTQRDEDTQKSTVTYNGVQLLSGEIYFERVDAEKNAVTYILNGVKHVVYLRIAPST